MQSPAWVTACRSAPFDSLIECHVMADQRPIGIFDSGVGGLTVLRAIREQLPEEPTIYLADLYHFPYGPRYQDEVRGFAFDIIRYLESRDVKLVVIACNTATAAALDRHRLAFDSKVGRRDAAAAIDERELERLPVCEISQAGLLDRGNVDEHVLAAIIADDEAKALLGIEKLDDALAFANDLRRHSATTAATKAAASAAAAAAETTAAAATTEATAVTKATAAAAEATAVAITASAAAAAKATTFLVAEFSADILFAETVALVAAAPAAVPLAPSIETHAPSELKGPPTAETDALGPNGAAGHDAQNRSRAGHALTRKI